MIRETELALMSLVVEILKENKEGNGIEISRAYDMPPHEVTIKINLQKIPQSKGGK